MASSTNDLEDLAWKLIHDEAYATFNRGELAASIPLFKRLASEHAERGYYEYMLGLAHKYRRDWVACIRHNQRAISEAAPDTNLEGERWNIAIAATALGDWALARDQWIACGITLEPGDAPLDQERGVVSVRLNAWDGGETLYAQRIGLARGRLINIPLTNSGHRLGDIVLLDGAKTGERRYGDATVPVFNALQRLQPSDLRTFEVRVDCASRVDADALEEATGPGIGGVEDWSRSIAFLCKSCSNGVPHAHAEQAPDATGWIRERRIGIAAESRMAVDALLDGWAAEGRTGAFLERLARRHPRRAVLAVDEEEFEQPALIEREKWWIAPESESQSGPA